MNGRWGRGCRGHWLEFLGSLRGLQFGPTDHFIKVVKGLEGPFVLLFSGAAIFVSLIKPYVGLYSWGSSCCG